MNNDIKKALEKAIEGVWTGKYESVAIVHSSKLSRYKSTSIVNRENIDDFEIYDGCVFVIKSTSTIFTVLVTELMKITKESYGTFIIEDDDTFITISFTK